MAEIKVWSLLSLDDEDRQFSGNDGYDDLLGIRYSYDSTVQNCRKIEAGHIGVVRDHSQFLGFGVIHRIIQTLGTKERNRCPKCEKTGFKERTRVSPRFRCKCGHQFDQPRVETLEAVRLYVAEFGADWQTLPNPIPVTGNEELYMNRAFLQSMRQLHSALWMSRAPTFG